MAKKPASSLPGFDFDLTKIMGEFDPAKFDPSKMITEFNKALTDLKMPGVDFKPVIDSQRRNMEALAAANKLALEGMQAVFKRQSEILRASVEEAMSSAKDLSVGKPGSVPESVAKQVDMLKLAVEQAIENMRELAEMVSKSNTEAFSTINKRFNESLDEIKSQALKLKK